MIKLGKSGYHQRYIFNIWYRNDPIVTFCYLHVKFKYYRSLVTLPEDDYFYSPMFSSIHETTNLHVKRESIYKNVVINNERVKVQ